MKVFGLDHILFLCGTVVFFILTIILSKKYLKTVKSQKIFLKILAAISFTCVVLNRIKMGMNYKWIYVVPNSYCALTSFSFGLIMLIFGKPNMKIYNWFWYMGFTGGLVTLIYPDFIQSATSLFQFEPLTSLIHHGFLLLYSIELIVLGWFKPNLKNLYLLPLGIMCYIIYGFLDIAILKVDDSMCITQPMLSGTPINCWFVLGVGTVLAIVVNIVIEKVGYLINKKRSN